MDSPTHAELSEQFFKQERTLARRMVRQKAVAEILGQFFSAPASLPLAKDPHAGERFVLSLIYAATELASQEIPTPFSDAILEHPTYETMLRAISAGAMRNPAAREQLMTYIHAAQQEAWHRRAGQHVYELSPVLADELLGWSVRGLDVGDLQLPFESVYLVVPKVAGIELGLTPTERLPLVGIYITEDLSRRHVEGRMWHCCFVGASADAEKPLDDSLYYFTVYLPDGASLDEALDRSDHHIAENAELKDVADVVSTEWRALFAFAMNAVIYATWPEARRGGPPQQGGARSPQPLGEGTEG